MEAESEAPAGTVPSEAPEDVPHSEFDEATAERSVETTDVAAEGAGSALLERSLLRRGGSLLALAPLPGRGRA